MIRDIQYYVEAYETGDQERILYDAVDDPALQPFIEESDIETGSEPGGTVQYQVRVLTTAGAKRVVRRLITTARNAGVDLREWICGTGREDFNLCALLHKLGWTRTMADLDAFLKKKWASWPAAAVGVFAAGLLAKIITALTVLGFVSRELIEMCGCQPDSPMPGRA